MAVIPVMTHLLRVQLFINCTLLSTYVKTNARVTFTACATLWLRRSRNGKVVAVLGLVMGCTLLHHLAIVTLSVLVDTMNTAQLESITSAAMTLPERERAKLARDLVASLDGPADISVAEAWDTEICRRINDIESGKTELLNADEAIARARSRIRSCFEGKG